MPVAVRRSVGSTMVNFADPVGDRETGEAVVIDPAYDVAGLSDILEADGMRLTGALVTHYHPDHVGGDFMGIHVEGIREASPSRVAAFRCTSTGNEAWGVRRVTGCSENDMVQHEAGDVLMVGEVPITMLHTPGHTPGSQCFLLDNMLVSGDTLFLEGCGRVDLPGASPEQMYDSPHPAPRPRSATSTTSAGRAAASTTRPARGDAVPTSWPTRGSPRRFGRYDRTNGYNRGDQLPPVREHLACHRRDDTAPPLLGPAGCSARASTFRRRPRPPSSATPTFRAAPRPGRDRQPRGGSGSPSQRARWWATS